MYTIYIYICYLYISIYICTYIYIYMHMLPPYDTQTCTFAHLSITIIRQRLRKSKDPKIPKSRKMQDSVDAKKFWIFRFSDFWIFRFLDFWNFRVV